MSETKKVKMTISVTLFEFVLSSAFYREREHALVENINEHCFWVVQRLNSVMWSTMYYDNLRQSLHRMIICVAEHIMNIEDKYSLELKRCLYYQEFLDSILSQCSRMHFKVYIMKGIPRKCNDMRTKQAFYEIQGLVNETYFALFGSPEISGVNFQAYNVIIGPRNKMKKNLTV